MIQKFLSVRAMPRAKISRTEVDDQGRIRVWVNAPPARGAANQALLTILAEALGIPRSEVRLVSGNTFRDKLVVVTGMDVDDARARIRRSAQS